MQGPIKAEPNMDSPSVAAVEGGPGGGDPMDVDGTTEIPADKSTVLKVRAQQKHSQHCNEKIICRVMTVRCSSVHGTLSLICWPVGVVTALPGYGT